MKLKNKKTGEILEHALLSSYGVSGDVTVEFMDENAENGYSEYARYHSLAELNAEWEDAPEEPKEYWCIDCDGTISRCRDDFGTPFDNACKALGNCFETKEEAEKAVEKLKAIQRLKNYYLKFKLDFIKNKIDFTYRLDGTLHSSVDEERIIFEDMNLLFGGEK